MKNNLRKIKVWLSGLSFKTGLIVFSLCVPFYLLSFAAFALPVSVAARGGLWALLFGLAKIFQYSGILILGKEGLKRIKTYWNRKEKTESL